MTQDFTPNDRPPNARSRAVTAGPSRAAARSYLRAAGMQDAASQFVQLTWLFTTQPQRLQVGKSVEMPLALPRRADRWIYDVRAEEGRRHRDSPLAFEPQRGAEHPDRGFVYTLGDIEGVVFCHCANLN